MGVAQHNLSINTCGYQAIQQCSCLEGFFEKFVADCEGNVDLVHEGSASVYKRNKSKFRQVILLRCCLSSDLEVDV